MRYNIVLFKFQNFFNGLWLFSALAVIYFEQITGSYATAMLAFSFVNLFQSLAEVPCGMISDRISRKSSLVIGSICVFTNMVLWALAGQTNIIFLLFLGSALRGIGLAFKSGTDSAMIYETLQQIKKRKLFLIILSKISSFYQLGALIAAFAATVISYYFSLQTLVWVSVLPYFLTIIVNLLLGNPKSYFEKDMSPVNQLKKSIKCFIKNAKLRKYALLQIVNNSLSVSVFRFEASYFESLIPIYFVNITRALQHATGWISFHIVALFSKTNLLKILCLSSFGNSAIRLIALIMNNQITPFFNCLQNLFYGTSVSSSTSLLQQEYNKGLRATLDSIVNLFGGITTAFLGFLLGYIADILSPRSVLFIAVFASMLIAVTYGRLFKPSKKQ